MRLKAELERFPESRSWACSGLSLCYLCGEPADRDNARVFLVDVDTEERVAEPVCQTCVEVGAGGAAQRMQNYADALRRHAEQLDNLTDAVARIAAEEWPQVTDLFGIR